MKKISQVLLGYALAGLAVAAPHVPRDDNEVLERLPTRRGDPAMAELRNLRAAAAARPGDAPAAAALARRYFELAMAEGDPRYVGYAQAALGLWPGGDGPAEILFVRGLLKQYRHDFAGALDDLLKTSVKDPSHVGAHSWRAAIFMVGAVYGAALGECRALDAVASALVATGCSAYVDA